MQRLINDPDRVVEDMLDGFVKCHSGLVVKTRNPRVLKHARAPVAGKVGVVTGGGSGHEPAFIGYIGENMLDAVAVGEVFSSPTAKSFYDAFKEADAGRGVACLYGNYAGDNMNVRMAIQMFEDEGRTVKTVVANDDVPSAPVAEIGKRRGVAGEVLMWKIGAAKAALGGSLDEVIAAAQKAIDNTRSIGVGLTSCTIPAVGHPNFSIEPGMMEVGIGHHGEPGIRVTGIERADDVARLMVESVLPDLPFSEADEVVVLVSGLGSTPIMELYITYAQVDTILKAAGIRVHQTYVGNYFTSLDMMGMTLTIMRVDDELKALVDHPARSLGFNTVAGN